MQEIIGGQAIIEGNFTEEETESIAKELSGNQTEKTKFGPGKHTFELRLASYQKVEGWEIGPRSRTANTPLWISPEVALTNRDVARAYRPDRTDLSKLCVGILLTEDGALKMARLTKSHIGKNLAVILDGRAVSVFPIVDGIHQWTSLNTRQLY